MQPRLREQGNPPLHLPAPGWSLAQLEPSRWCREEFGRGRNGRSRCRERIPVGNDLCSRGGFTRALISPITSREGQTELGSDSPKAFLICHKGAGSLALSLSPSAPSAPHPQIFQCWEVPQQPLLLLFSPNSLSWV